MRASSMATNPCTRREGLTLLEVAVSVAVLAVVTGAVAQLFIQSSRAFTSQAVQSNVIARGQVVMDRVVGDLVAGVFVTMTPPIPANSSYIRFQRSLGFAGGAAVLSNPMQIDVIPEGESAGTDALRIWEDLDPQGTTPGAEDRPVIVAMNLAPNGLRFNRTGAILEVAMDFVGEVEPGEEAILLTLTSGVKMRNDD